MLCLKPRRDQTIHIGDEIRVAQQRRSPLDPLETVVNCADGVRIVLRWSRRNGCLERVGIEAPPSVLVTRQKHDPEICE